MHCTDCGYMMTAFDKDCPRCARLRARTKGCPHCGTAAPLGDVKCGKCGHLYRTASTHQEAARRDDAWEAPEPTQPLAPAAPLAASPAATPTFAPPAPPTPLTAEMLACRVCGNTSGQKVSAVCQQGTWSGVARGQSFGAIYTADGPIPVSSVSATSSSGGTQIAQALMPPPRPSFRHGWTGSILVPLLGYPCALAACFAGGLAASVVIAATSILWFFVLLAESRAEAVGQTRLQGEHARWQAAMAVWDRLFYCSRCDHVYDPHGGGTARPSGLSSLLFAHLPVAATPLPPRELPLRLPPEKAAAIACGTALIALALVWGAAWGIGRMAQDTPPQAVTGDVAPTTVDGSGVAPTPPSVSAAPPDMTASPTAPSGEAAPAPAFSMRTKAGGGAPPDLSQFTH